VFFPLEKTSSQYGEGWSSSDQVARNGQGQPQLVRRTRGTARTGTKREKDDDEKKNDFFSLFLSSSSFVSPCADSRVCGAHQGLIRKYGLMICRRCFRERAEEIGFIK
jgi:ribosomal protein S14